jgi:DNA-binding LytR/AlgR family response regulator
LEELQGYLNENIQLDIAFLETRLSDGPTFDICYNSNVQKPIIFTSSSKEDAFNAFKVNGIDYLLEPLKYEDFSMAMKKALTSTNSGLERDVLPKYKKRFLVKIGDKLKSKRVKDISYVFAEGKTVYIVSRRDNRRYIVEHTLDELENIYLNPNDFFRINRKFIVSINAIDEVRNYVNSRLKLILNPANDQDMIVSREKVVDFKNWLNL